MRYCLILAVLVVGCTKKPARELVAPMKEGSSIATVKPEVKKCILTEWDHGLQTDRVVATRYRNKISGYSIGFRFPKNPADCDRAELCDWMEAKGGTIYQCGGSPGAEMFVAFKDVKDKESANAKLKEILPDLNALMESF